MLKIIQLIYYMIPNDISLKPRRTDSSQNPGGLWSIYLHIINIYMHIQSDQECALAIRTLTGKSDAGAASSPARAIVST